MTRKRDRLGRRALLKSLGLGVAASPFVPLLTASGDDPTPPARLLLFFTPHGTVRDNWLPTGTDRDFTLGPILSPLEAFKDRMLVLDGLNMRVSNSFAAHTEGPVWLWSCDGLQTDTLFYRDQPGQERIYFGWNKAPSFDQVLAQTMSAGLRYESIEVGVRTGVYQFPGSRMIYSAAGAPKTPYSDPRAALDNIFGMGSETEQERRRRERRSILDVLKGELGAIRGAVAQADRPKIDQHLSAVRDVERALMPGGVCEAPVLGAPLNPLLSSDMPGLLEQQMRIVRGCFTCDLTRVASVQVTVGENDGTVYDWTGVDRDVHHLITHESDARGQADLSTIYTWYASQFARLLQLLDEVEEGDGTMLDNTLVVWGSEIGTGYNHSFDNIPFIVAGGGNLGIDTGRFLSLGGLEHNRLVVTLCNALGRPDIQTFGSEDIGSGPIPGILT